MGSRKAGETLGEKGVVDCLRSVCGSINGDSTCELLARPKTRLDRFRGSAPPVDDRTLVLIRRTRDGVTVSAKGYGHEAPRCECW